MGYILKTQSMNPYEVVNSFEKLVAEWCGAKFGVAVESGTAAIFLSLQYRKVMQRNGGLKEVTIPCRTYPSVPCSVIHAGGRVKFEDKEWEGEYELRPYRIWDSALRLKKGMFGDKGRIFNGLQCLSFHIKKLLPIGRGGMILTDDENAYKWLKLARFDGRNPIPLQDDYFTMLGWNAYMQPADAARGIQLFEVMKQKYPDGMEDLKVEEQGYPNLDLYPIYKK